MRNSKKLILVVLSVVAAMLLATVAWAANDLGVTFTANAEAPNLTVSDTEQTVVVTVSASQEIELDGIGTKGMADTSSVLLVPDGFTVESVVCGNSGISLQYEASTAKVTSDNASGDNFAMTNILVITYTVPANTPSGSYTLGIQNFEITKDFGDTFDSEVTATTTLTIAEPHTCEHDNYGDITDTTHQSYCVCGEKIGDPEPHDYDETTHVCDCEDVEKFELTVYTLGFWQGDEMLSSDLLVNLWVPFGASIEETLADYLDDDGVYLPGDDVVLNDKMYEGTATVTAWMNLNTWEPVSLDTLTMPGERLELSQEYVFTGWYYEYYDFTIGSWSDTCMGISYLEDSIMKDGWQNIDGAWYYFAYNEEQYSYYRTEGTTRAPYPEGYAPNAEDVAYEGADFIDAETGLFVFDEDGKFQKDLTGIVDGKYVKNGQIVWHYGLVEEDGEYYYFVGDEANGGNKLADDGVVYLIRTNGIEGFAQGAAYVVEGGIPQYKNYGLVEIGGNYYYVRSNGEKVTGTSYWITNTNGLGVIAQAYTFDENGVMQDPAFAAEGADGIVDGYYYEDGELKAGAGLIELEDGSIIYVRSNGKVATGMYWATNHNGVLPEGMYNFGEDGKLIAE